MSLIGVTWTDGNFWRVELNGIVYYDGSSEMDGGHSKSESFSTELNWISVKLMFEIFVLCNLG
jgi:hypothetical protein